MHGPLRFDDVLDVIVHDLIAGGVICGLVIHDFLGCVLNLVLLVVDGEGQRFLEGVVDDMAQRAESRIIVHILILQTYPLPAEEEDDPHDGHHAKSLNPRTLDSKEHAAESNHPILLWMHDVVDIGEDFDQEEELVHAQYQLPPKCGQLVLLVVDEEEEDATDHHTH